MPRHKKGCEGINCSDVKCVCWCHIDSRTEGQWLKSLVETAKFCFDERKPLDSYEKLMHQLEWRLSLSTRKQFLKGKLNAPGSVGK